MKIGDYISWPLALVAVALIAAATAVIVLGPDEARAPIVTVLMTIATVTPSFVRSLGSQGCALDKSPGDTPSRGLPLPRALHIPPAPPMPKCDEDEDDDDRDPPDPGASAGPMHDHIDGAREDDDGHAERVSRIVIPGAVFFGVLRLAGALAGCGGASAETRAAYALEEARCVAAEREIVDRAGSTEERDRADLAAERARCDAALAAIEGGAR